VPVGTAELLQERLATAPPAELASLTWYKVRRGESLAAIAQKLRVSRAELAEANHLSVRASLRVGQELVVPRPPASLMAARVDRPAPAADALRASRSLGAVSSATPGGRQSEQARLIYRVKPGDTLSHIARLFDTTVAELKAWNRLNSNLIRAGSRLTIYR
jgi:LysM repeat protein